MWNPFAVASVVPATTKVNYYCVMEGAVVRHTLSASGYRRCLRGGGTVRPVTPMSMLLEHAYEPVIMATLLVASGSANAPVLMTATRVKVGTLHCPFCRSMLLPWCVCACCTNHPWLAAAERAWRTVAKCLSTAVTSCSSQLTQLEKLVVRMDRACKVMPAGVKQPLLKQIKVWSVSSDGTAVRVTTLAGPAGRASVTCLEGLDWAPDPDPGGNGVTLVCGSFDLG